MSARAVVSAVAHRRLARARAWLHAQGQAREVLIVGASLASANELARSVAKIKGGAFGWYRLTLPQLAASVAAPELAERGLAPLSRIGTSAFVAWLVHRLQTNSGLGRYASIATTPGFSRALADVITELRLAAVSTERVRSIAPDLGPLLAEYERALVKAGLVDWPGLLAIAAGAARRRQHRFFGLPMLFVDVPVASKTEYAFFAAIVEASPDVLMTIHAGDEATLGRVAEGAPLETDNPDEGQLPDSVQAAEPQLAALKNLQRCLFRGAAIAPDLTLGEAIDMFSAPGEGRECIEIARRALALARAGMPFDRIAVLLRSPETYRASLAEAFARAQIPVHFARGSVRPDPAGRAFCVLLKCAIEGLSARRFAEYLSLGQLPEAATDGAPPNAAERGERWAAPDSESLLGSEEGDEERETGAHEMAANEGAVSDRELSAPWRWERLLVDAAVIGGRDRWRRRLHGLAGELRLRLAEVAGEDEGEAAMLERTLGELGTLAAYALPLIDALDGLPRTTTWGEWMDALGALATQSLKRYDRVLAVFAELAPLAPIGPVTLDEVLVVLEPLLLEAAVPPSSRRQGKLFVGPPDACRGLSFDAVFVPGLAERVFPRKIIEEPILLDALRTKIDGSLATNQARLQRERLALALAVGAAERRICFSYPRLELDQGRPRVPSFYALEVVRAAEGRLPDFAEIARRAETATTARLGWPAPHHSTDAIDNAEHDLAALNRLLEVPEAGAGSARYLVNANPHLARALRTRYQRWSRAWTAADGLVGGPDAVRLIMARHAPGARAYSPTALQHFAACPYRFLLHAIHGLRPREVPDTIDRLDALQRGSIVHEVQFELLASLRRDALLPVRPSTLQAACQRLDAIIVDVAARYRDELAPAIARVWEDGIAAIRADLREWLRLASEDESGYVPWRFELAFGLKNRTGRRLADPHSVDDAVTLECGLQLRGSIDLIERHPDGRLRVTDHKTGKALGEPDAVIGGGQLLQPLLYALAAERLFAGGSPVAAGRFYFCTSAGGYIEHVVALDRRARELAVRVTETIGDALARPFLPAAPGKGECARCDYRIVCGPHEDRRTGRKSPGPLEPLLTLRDLP